MLYNQVAFYLIVFTSNIGIFEGNCLTNATWEDLDVSTVSVYCGQSITILK